MKTDASTPKESPKDSTNALPMYELQEAVDFVHKIHEKALEPETMVAVAKGLGYAHASSTPFYRRVVAARLFGLLSQSGAELTKRAVDYFRPDSEGAKERALADAVIAIPYYAERIGKLEGKKVNTQYIVNGMMETFTITKGCATICANAFVSSLKFAGLLTLDGLVASNPAAPQVQQKPLIQDIPSEQQPEVPVVPTAKGMRQHVLDLDEDMKRSFTAIAPRSVTRAEYTRICKWLEFTLIVKDEPGKDLPHE